MDSGIAEATDKPPEPDAGMSARADAYGCNRPVTIESENQGNNVTLKRGDNLSAQANALVAALERTAGAGNGAWVAFAGPESVDIPRNRIRQG